MMRRLAKFVASTLLAVISLQVWAAGDSIVVVVNDQIITSDDIAKLQSFMLDLSIVPSLTEKEAENILVDRLLIEQAATELGVEVSDSDVFMSIDGIARQRGIAQEDLHSEVVRHDVRWVDYEDYIRANLMQQAYAARAFFAEAQVSQKEVDAYMKQHQSVEYHYVDLLVPLEKGANQPTVQAAKTSAKAWQKKLEAMKEVKPESTPTLTISDSGWSAPSHIPDLFLSELNKLSDDQVSGLIKVANGYHVLKLLGKRQGKGAVTEAQVRVILKNQAMQKRLQSWLEEQRKKAYIKYFD